MRRLFFIAALASSDEAMSQRDALEKSSVRISVPRPGRISGVGALVDKVISVGVADGGNQMMVGVGGGVSVAVSGVGVASIASSWAQDEVSIDIARIIMARRFDFVRTKERILIPLSVKVENIIFIW